MKDLKAAVQRTRSPYLSIPHPPAALARARSLAGQNGRILVCGSIYLLQYLFGERESALTG
jgi:folylpolyglutamate synthase/dihydropteroate synthase